MTTSGVLASGGGHERGSWLTLTTSGGSSRRIKAQAKPGRKVSYGKCLPFIAAFCLATVRCVPPESRRTAGPAACLTPAGPAAKRPRGNAAAVDDVGHRRATLLQRRSPWGRRPKCMLGSTVFETTYRASVPNGGNVVPTWTGAGWLGHPPEIAPGCLSAVAGFSDGVGPGWT